MTSHTPSPDEGLLAALTPLLASVARLLAKGSPTEAPQLTQLLVGVGLDDHPAALAELQRWSRLLGACRSDPETLREATIEALMARGIPEAQAALAVATVHQEAETPPEPQADADEVLRTSIERLDFGTLPPRQPATAEFEAEGGPGWIRADNHHVHVEPDTFGPQRTRVRVTVAPFDGMVMTALRLVTRKGELSIPLFASWEAAESNESITTHAPAPARAECTDRSEIRWKKQPETGSGKQPETGPKQQPERTIDTEPEPIVLVDPEGHGDFPTLEEALDQAPPAATIRLAPGTHRLKAPLTIRRPARIEGQPGPDSQDRVRLEGRGQRHLVRIETAGAVRVAHVHFVHRGHAACHVVQVLGGEVDFENCAFEGGRCDSGDKYGAGLQVGRKARARIQGCVAHNNQGDGFRFQDQAQGVVSDSQTHSNGKSGMLLTDGATGKLSGNRCENNEIGIRVASRARAFLASNECRKNKKAGVSCTNSSRVALKGNECHYNEGSGIDVSHDARVRALRNHCDHNGGAGITCWDDTTGILTANECDHNTCAGIHITDRARLTVRRNHCHHNGTAGIAFCRKSRGKAAENRCEENQQEGIFVGNRASASLGPKVSTEDHLTLRRLLLG